MRPQRGGTQVSVDAGEYVSRWTLNQQSFCFYGFRPQINMRYRHLARVGPPADHNSSNLILHYHSWELRQQPVLEKNDSFRTRVYEQVDVMVLRLQS